MSFKLKSINKFLIESTDNEIFDENTTYSINQFLKLCRQSDEAKKAEKGNYNFGKGIRLARELKKSLPEHKFKCRVVRSEWNYGGNLVLIIELRGRDYNTIVFRYNSGDSTRQPVYSFSNIFDGTIKPSEPNQVEKEWGLGIIHGSFQSISNYDKFIKDIIGVFKDYKRVNGVAFSMKEALAKFKVNAKIKNDWSKIEDKIFDQYVIAKENARKVSYEIELRQPRIDVDKKKIYYKTYEPRILRHPDEYGDHAEELMSKKEYYNYENAQSKIGDMIEKFAKKHGFEFIWAADWN